MFDFIHFIGNDFSFPVSGYNVFIYSDWFRQERIVNMRVHEKCKSFSFFRIGYASHEQLYAPCENGSSR